MTSTISTSPLFKHSLVALSTWQNRPDLADLSLSISSWNSYQGAQATMTMTSYQWETRFIAHLATVVVLQYHMLRDCCHAYYKLVNTAQGSAVPTWLYYRNLIHDKIFETKMIFFFIYQYFFFCKYFWSLHFHIQMVKFKPTFNITLKNHFIVYECFITII